MGKVEKDFEELLRSFNKHKVRYCVIGAYAVAFYSTPRYTKDIDILVDPDSGNAERIVSALEEFGFKGLGLSADDFSRECGVIQLGYEPVRVDILTSVEGIDFDKAWRRKRTGSYGGARVHFVGLDDLIRMKRKSGRKQDLVDVELLKVAKRRERKG